MKAEPGILIAFGYDSNTGEVLGVLAGDTIRSAADLKLALVAVTLAHRQGYFAQKLDANGWQSEAPVAWDVAKFCRELPPRVQVGIEGRIVHVRAWQYTVKGISGHEMPVILLDTGLPENSEWDRALTDHLYGGDSHYRLCQEVVLGIGGVRMLRALGYHDVSRFHMNEVFCRDGELNMTYLALNLSHYVNGVAKKHGEVSRQMLTPHDANHHYQIEHITNGVHLATWASPSFSGLFDRHVPGWREDNASLRAALHIPKDEVWQAHQAAKTRAIDGVAQGKDAKNRTPQNARALYQKLGQVVMPAFYQKRDDWLRVMRHAIAVNASHFNTQRMVQEYIVKAYFQ